MKALVYTSPKELEYRDEPDPTPEAGEALIRIEASGICGSDMHAYFVVLYFAVKPPSTAIICPVI